MSQRLGQGTSQAKMLNRLDEHLRAAFLYFENLHFGAIVTRFSLKRLGDLNISKNFQSFCQ